MLQVADLPARPVVEHILDHRRNHLGDDRGTEPADQPGPDPLAVLDQEERDKEAQDDAFEHVKQLGSKFLSTTQNSND